MQMYDLDEMETFLDTLIQQDRISTPEQQKLNHWVSTIFNEAVKHTTTCTKCINKRIAKLKKYIAEQRAEAAKLVESETPEKVEDAQLKATDQNQKPKKK